MGKNRSRRDPGRDGGGFIALPWSVVDSPAWPLLSHPAKALAIEFARQVKPDNNGRLLASIGYLRPRGWKSTDVIQRAKKELLAAGFIFETVIGQCPNKASWYAVTWRTLDPIPGYDEGVKELFKRGAYRFQSDKGAIISSRKKRNQPCANGRFVVAPNGTTDAPVVPSDGIDRTPVVPSGGAIATTLGTSPIPFNGHHLEVPSISEYLEHKNMVPNKPAQKRGIVRATPLGRLKSLKNAS